MVPEGGRHATSDIWAIGEAALRAIFVACGTRGACDPTFAGRGRAGDRPADGTVGVDDLAGASTQCRDAQRRPCRIEAKPLAEASGWLEGYRQIWEGNFQRLDALLDELKTEAKTRGHTRS